MSEQQQAEKPRRPFFQRVWREWVMPLSVTFIVLGTVRSVVADWNDVPTGSMEPTILPGDRIFVNKLAFGLRVPFTDQWVTRWGAPERGDIVICFSPKDGTRLVKRVVGIPGDTVELKDNVLTVNGAASQYGLLDVHTQDQIEAGRRGMSRFATETLTGREHAVMFSPWVPARRNFGPATLGAGEYFMMGDNRDNSGDSRIFGVVHEDMIQGRALGVALSFDADHGWSPRWDRWGSGVK